MSNLTPEQERINHYHNHHKANHVFVDLVNCQECRRQHNWQPPSHVCNWCEDRIPNDNQEAAIAHNEYHMKHPESITK